MENNQQNGAQKLFSNPMISRLRKIEERSDDCATYRGVFGKCMYFMAMIVAGAVLSFLLHLIPGETFDQDGLILSLNMVEIVVAAVMLLVFLVCPFVATFVLKAVPVAGGLSCFSIGYIVAFSGLLIPEYRPAILMAIGFTFVIVLVMQVLMMNGLIRTGNLFKRVLVCAACCYVCGGVGVALIYLIPAFAAARDFFSEYMWISIAVSAIGVILAVLFLLADFDEVREAVERQLPKKYEWRVAYSLSFTVIWLFFEIFNLILKIKDTQKS